MLVPEKPRRGEIDPENCGTCQPSEFTIWADEHWQPRGGWETGGLPAMSEEMMNEHIEIVATALAAGGGTAFPQRAA